MFFLYSWASGLRFDSHVQQLTQRSANQARTPGRLLSPRVSQGRSERKRLQATSQASFWTAQGTGHTLLPSQPGLKDSLFLYRCPTAGTASGFETLLLRERAKMLHKVKNQCAAQTPRRASTEPSLKALGALLPCTLTSTSVLHGRQATACFSP